MNPGAIYRSVAVKCVGSIGARPRWVDAGHDWADDPDIGLAELSGPDVYHGAVRQDQVERFITERSPNCSCPGFLIKVAEHKQTLAPGRYCDPQMRL